MLKLLFPIFLLISGNFTATVLIVRAELVWPWTSYYFIFGLQEKFGAYLHTKIFCDVAGLSFWSVLSNIFTRKISKHFKSKKIQEISTLDIQWRWSMSGTPIDFQSISHAMSALLNLIFCFIFFSNYGPFMKRKKYLYICTANQFYSY